MLLKVLNGTNVESTKSLCASCRHAVAITGQCETMLECDMISSSNNFRLNKIQPVVKCTYYDNKSTPSISSMKEIAWSLEPNKKTGTLGFAQPKKKSYDYVTTPWSGKDIF